MENGIFDPGKFMEFDPVISVRTLIKYKLNQCICRQQE